MFPSQGFLWAEKYLCGKYSRKKKKNILSFPKAYKDIKSFLDYVFLQVSVNKRSSDKLEELSDIFHGHRSTYKQTIVFTYLFRTVDFWQFREL